MTARPIIFSAPMVRALLDGRKTQTRRILKPQPGELDRVFRLDDGTWHQSAADGTHMSIPRLLYVVGDRLWVREIWQDYCPIWQGYWCGCGSVEQMARDHRPVYAADPLDTQNRIVRRSKTGDPELSPPLKWRPPVHMPRWASRLTLTVTDVRLQRLQDISEGDAKAEGVYPEFEVDIATFVHNKTFDPVSNSTHRLGFKHLWDYIHGGGKKPALPWDANPLVVALTFTVAQKNINAEEIHANAPSR